MINRTVGKLPACKIPEVMLADRYSHHILLAEIADKHRVAYTGCQHMMDGTYHAVAYCVTQLTADLLASGQLQATPGLHGKAMRKTDKGLHHHRG